MVTACAVVEFWSGLALAILGCEALCFLSAAGGLPITVSDFRTVLFKSSDDSATSLVAVITSESLFNVTGECDRE